MTAHLVQIGHATIIGLLLAILHGLKFRFEIEKNGDGKQRIKYRVYFANKNQ